MNTLSRTLLASLVVAGLACGSPQKTSKATMSRLAADAPPPPSGGAGKIERKVSDDAVKDFAAAVAFFNDQAKAGWSHDACISAAHKFEQVANDNDKLVEAHFNAGLSYQTCGIMKEAEAAYQQALKINPAHAPSLSNLGQIYFLGGNEPRAKQYWESAVQADQKTPAAHNNLAWLLIRQVHDGKADLHTIEPEALGHLQRTLAVENDNVEAYVLLAMLYMEGSDKNKSRLTLAKLLLDKGKEFNDKFPALYNAYGLLSLKQDNVADALVQFQQAAALQPSFVEAHMNVGDVVLDFRKYDDAATEFQAVLKLQPKNYDAMIGLGVAQRGNKDLDKAEATYKRASDLDSNRAEAYYNLGVLYKDFKANKTDDLKVAKQSFETAIRYFRQAMGKPNATPSMQSDAKENVEDCEKAMKSLDEAIQFRESQPKDATPTPTPTPAAGSSPAPAGGATAKPAPKGGG